jgi:small subunit ribosomal protein S8
MLTRIRNATERRHTHVAMPHSVLKQAIAGILKEEGFIDDFDVVDSQPARPMLRLKLRYTPERKSVISHLERVSRPGRRVYAGKREIPWVLSGMGIAILTTPRGVMTGQQARRENVGGEVLCYVW